MGVMGFVLFFALIVIGAFAFLSIQEPPVDADRALISGNVVEGPLLQAQAVPIAENESNFSFIGYGPGKLHHGTFNEWDAEVLVNDENIVGFVGTIQTASVQTDTERVTKHLQTEDFFDSTQFPTIAFETIRFDKTNSALTGLVTFRNITKEISFPVNVTENSISADFVLDTKPFEMKYEKITNEVKITFVLVRP